MGVGSRARTATASLDSKEIVQQTAGEMAVEVFSFRAVDIGVDDEGENRLVLLIFLSQNPNSRSYRKTGDCVLPNLQLAALNEFVADVGLDSEREGGTELLHYRRGARVFSLL